jgi:hypothetical protein
MLIAFRYLLHRAMVDGGMVDSAMQRLWPLPIKRVK